MGNPSVGQTGVVPNSPSEAWVPIQTWNMILVNETPISWFLGLDNGTQYRFWKGEVTPNPPEPAPVVGQVHGWSISNSVAQAAGLLPMPNTPPGTMSAAQQAGQAQANQIQEQSTPPPMPEVGP
jgi:hypothetical protein